jgi:acyl-CoA synthetase (AMP-forming)/AMP-acid ligase II
MIFRAPEPPLGVPDLPLTPFLLDRARERGDKPAFIDGPTGRTLTYEGWRRAVRSAARGLSLRGFRPGDVLALYSPNLPEYAVAFHAVSLLGGVTTTVNPLDTAGELSGQLRDSGARYLVTSPALLAAAEPAARENSLAEVFVFGEAPGATAFAALVQAEGEPPPAALDPRQDTVVLPYSSGATGLPKGVMLTHRNLLANVLQSAAALGVSESDVLLGVLPFFHAYGMVVAMNLGLHVGATVITLPSDDPQRCLEALQRYRVSFAPVVPPLVHALVRHPAAEGCDLGALHTLLSGGAPLAPNVAMAASARLGCRVIQGYGLTEASPVTHATRTRSDRFRPGGVGPPVPDTEARVIDVTTGEELGPNQEGEICVRGPQVMKGYLGRPEATAAMIDAEGWLHTGDVGYADEDGCFFVVDRVKELIKYKGLPIAPAELEAVLLSHPAVADAAVISVPDEEAGEVPKAFVVLSGAGGTENLLGWVAERLASYKAPRALEVVDHIPRLPSGKLLRRVLAERTRAGPA